ncbi:FecR domain-containing protein [Chitinophaga defluvii]|uniref:FecR domain-containing protein n=1 Tax=Chitinophaga defluvii TaxID=3163343 RepID=A0ABV2TEG5_9BACT
MKNRRLTYTQTTRYMDANMARVQYLLDKHLQDSISQEEQEELYQLLGQDACADLLKQATGKIWEEKVPEAVYTAADWEKIYAQLAIPTPPPARNTGYIRKIWTGLAAAAILTAVIFLVYRFNSTPPDQPAMVQNTAPPATHTWLHLPDGSTVLLHAGSKLEYGSGFGTASREVHLSGEAYFNIAQQAGQPFIIHSGKLKTTVLGTAFNIRAYPGQNNITVTVKQGKVRVENEKGTVGELTANKEVIYNTLTGQAENKSADVMASTSWARQDMLFASASFDVIAQQLSKRYNVTISFKDTTLKQSRFKVMFDGTESLDEIMEILCTMGKCTYTIQGNTVLIHAR